MTAADANRPPEPVVLPLPVTVGALRRALGDVPSNKEIIWTLISVDHDFDAETQEVPYLELTFIEPEEAPVGL